MAYGASRFEPPSNGSKPFRWPPRIRFYLDEGLPWAVAAALRQIDYPILDHHSEDRTGQIDPVLIPWMATEGVVWVTKDDEAKKAHIGDIRKQRLSVVWIRGIEREKNRVTPHHVHLMLTVKLPFIAAALAASNAALHHELYLHGQGHSAAVACHRLDPHRIAPRIALTRARLK